MVVPRRLGHLGEEGDDDRTTTPLEIAFVLAPGWPAAAPASSVLGAIAGSAPMPAPTLAVFTDPAWGPTSDAATSRANRPFNRPATSSDRGRTRFPGHRVMAISLEPTGYAFLLFEVRFGTMDASGGPT
jgi:hypothetical protein